MCGGGLAGEEVGMLPVPCLSPACPLPAGVRGGGDTMGTCCPWLPALPPARTGSHQAERGAGGGGLDNAMPLAWKIHAKQLFPLGACSWMRLRSGRRGIEGGGGVKNAGGPPAMEHHPKFLGDPPGAGVPCGGCGSIPGGMQDAQGCSGMLISPRSLGLPPRWVFFPLHLPGAGAAAA